MLKVPCTSDRVRSDEEKVEHGLDVGVGVHGFLKDHKVIGER